MTFTDGLISTLTGVAASYFVWWFTFRFLTPKVNFAESISRIPTKDNPSGFKYRFKFENIGLRNMIDIEVVIRVRIKGLRPDIQGNWEVVYLPISSLPYQKLAIVRPVYRKDKKRVRPVFEIKAYACDYFQKSFFNEETRKRSAEQTLTLDHVLKLGREANLQVLLFAYDEYSGARKFFESDVMTAGDIVDGYFDRKSVAVIAGVSKEETEDIEE